MAATTITVSEETRKLLESLKTGGSTYDDVIRGLIVSHSSELSRAELARRIRGGKPHAVEELIARSRRSV